MVSIVFALLFISSVSAYGQGGQARTFGWRPRPFLFSGLFGAGSASQNPGSFGQWAGNAGQWGLQSLDQPQGQQPQGQPPSQDVQVQVQPLLNQGPVLFQGQPQATERPPTVAELQFMAMQQANIIMQAQALARPPTPRPTPKPQPTLEQLGLSKPERDPLSAALSPYW